MQCKPLLAHVAEICIASAGLVASTCRANTRARSRPPSARTPPELKGPPSRPCWTPQSTRLGPGACSTCCADLHCRLRAIQNPLLTMGSDIAVLQFCFWEHFAKHPISQRLGSLSRTTLLKVQRNGCTMNGGSDRSPGFKKKCNFQPQV